MDEPSIRQILLARYYLELAAEELRSTTQPARFAAINLFHEALETTLITCAEHLNAKVTQNSSIEQYLDKINQKLADNELPFRRRILQFNKARVIAKHHLTLPDTDLVTSIGTVLPEFVREAVRLVFGSELEQISLVDLIEDKKVAEYVRDAQDQLQAKDHYSCLASVRKSFFRQFEKQYDIRKFAERGESEIRGVLSPFSFCRAPFHTKNPEYIENNVKCSSDYIVFDHSALNAELLQDGIDVQTFWNIWRLSPNVYEVEEDEWAIDHDFKPAEDPQIEESCVYVLDNLISITLKRESRRKRTRSKRPAYIYIQTKPNVPFYKMASKDSEITGYLPDGIRRVNVERAVPSLDGKGDYYQASYLAKGGPWLDGYIRAEDVEAEPQFGFVADGTDIAGAIPGSLSNE